MNSSYYYQNDDSAPFGALNNYYAPIAQSSCLDNNLQQMNYQQHNRFIYVKQNVLSANLNMEKPKNVHINPNFKPTTVHINPNFKNIQSTANNTGTNTFNTNTFNTNTFNANMLITNTFNTNTSVTNTPFISTSNPNKFITSKPTCKSIANPLVTNKTNVYINPNVFNVIKPNEALKPNNGQTTLSNDFKLNKNTESTSAIVIKTLPEKSKQSTSKNISNNKYKYVKKQGAIENQQNINVKQTDDFKLRRKLSYHSTYKIVRKSLTSQVNSTTNTPKSKYKLDRRNTTMISPKNTVKSKRTKYKIVNGDELLPTRKVLKIDKRKLKIDFCLSPNVRYIKLNGKLFRRSLRSLRKISESKINESKINENKIRESKISENINRINVMKCNESKNIGNKTKTNKYKIVRNKAACDTRYKIVTVLQNSNNDCQKSKKRAVFGRKILLCKTRFKKVQICEKKLKICNLPCPMYRKFGRCNGKDNGKCPRKHNPDQIALCTKFLQGACRNEKCPLSHNISSEKMPTCKFYLEGICSKEKCPYLHVKISPKADICKDFIDGYCSLGKECNKRHQFLCPDFEKYGNCPKKNCLYPHGSSVRNTRYAFVAKKFKFKANSNDVNQKKSRKNQKTILKVAKLNSSELNQNSNSVSHANNSSSLENPSEKISLNSLDVPEKSSRYFVDATSDIERFEVFNKNCNEERDNVREESPVRKRIKLGDLPLFIPFFSENT